MILFSFTVAVSASGSFSWTTVAIGGGGFVSAIVSSPIEHNLFYARTDVGGAYRWNQSSKRWIPLMDWADGSEQGLFGVEAIAADPGSADKVYMVAGTTYFNEGRSAFLRSSDRGNTWTVIYTWDTSGVKGAPVRKFYAHGNGMGRGTGERLAIDPANSNIMFYGSKAKGIFKSIDNGTTWNHVDGFTAAAGSDTTWNGSGFSFVTFAPGSSAILYAGFLRSKDNVFQSIDGGASWSLIPGRIKPATKGGYAPFLMPQRIAITPDGSRLYITFGNGAGPHTMAWDEGWGPIKDWFNRGAILQYETAAKTWSDVSPENFIDPGDKTEVNYYNADSLYVACYGGISLNPSNPLEIVASSIGYRAPQFWYIEATGKWKDQWGSNIYYTSDGGEHWTPSFQYYWGDGGIYPTAQQMNENGIGWMFNSTIHWSGCIAMDPFNSKHVFVTSGNGVFATEDITAFTTDSSKTPPLRQSTVWKVLSHGIEETVPLEVVSIPGGPLISVVGDYDGFRHDDVTKYPATRHQTNVNGSLVTFGTTRALAWAPKAGRLVKVTDAHSVNPTGNNNVSISPVQFSSDTGKTWTVATYENYPSQYQQGACVAISTDGMVTLWAPSYKFVNGSDVSGDYPVQRYANSSWTEVKDIDGAYVAGDPEDADVFYAFRKNEGAFYKSTDKGITFIKAGAPGVSDWRKFRLVPGKKGDIWIALGKNGLFRSVDGAATFAAISNVTNCEAVGFGKAAQGKSFPAVYIFGTVAAVTGVFQSIDEGATWVYMNDDAHKYGGLANGELVVGDMNMFGVVYRSTAGRGLACRLPSTMVEMNENAASSKSAKQASWRMDRGVLHVSPLAGDPQTVTLYSLTGRRLFHQSYYRSVNISINRVLQAKGVRVLVIGSKGTVAYTKIISVKP
jgi:xyloglucan-specific exo-beta-1,4-glucanase